MSQPLTFFATCAPGVEPVLHAEVKDLKLPKHERQVGGVRFVGSIQDMQRANLWLRSAGRVLMRLVRFEAHNSDALHRGAMGVEWEKWLPEGGTLRVDAQTKDSELDHSRFIEQRVKDAIVDHLVGQGRPRPQVAGEEADLRVHAHIWRNRVTLSLDTSGLPLRKRGYRVAQGKAPLSETLAAAIVLYSGWNGRSPLIDPFAGSGTLLIEAGLFASGTAPGLFRKRFGFENWANHTPGPWKKLVEAAKAHKKPLGKAPILGYDYHPERVAEAVANAENAGLGDKLRFEDRDARKVELKAGWNAQILTNPPYGVRVGNEAQMAPLYGSWGQLLQERAQGYDLTLLTQPALWPLLGLTGKEERLEVKNGALDCVVVKTKL